MMTRTSAAAAVRSRLRRWYPELITAAVIVAISQAGQKDDLLFAFFLAVVMTVGWVMGIRHRRLPLGDKIDKVGRDVTEVRDILLADDDAAEPEPGPGLHVVR
jgi:hypothetical protein